VSSHHFTSRYRKNLDWLQSKAVSDLNYDIQGTFLTLEVDDKELLSLLAERYGCFFYGEKVSSSRRIKIKKNKRHFIFTDSQGKSFPCRHMGEVLYPYLAHTFDEIYEALAGHLVFHGSAFSTDAGGILILGRAGAGKTSLLLEMIKRGFSYISDDVSIVDISGRKELIPNPQGFKLREPLLSCQGVERSGFKGKYINPCNIDNLDISSTCPLLAVILLADEKGNGYAGRPAYFGDYAEPLSKLIIPPSARKSSLGTISALFDKIPLIVMNSSKEIAVEKKAQNILDRLDLNHKGNSTLKAG